VVPNCASRLSLTPLHFLCLRRGQYLALNRRTEFADPRSHDHAGARNQQYRRHLRHPAAAAKYLRAYVRYPPKAPDVAQAEQKAAELERRATAPPAP